MKKEIILISLVFGAILILGGFFYLKKPLQIEPPSEKTECQFEIKEVYFKESDDPQNPILIIKGIVGPFGFHKYKIHFPPQEKTAQGIGPIEVGREEPCNDEKMCKPLDPCQQFQTQDFIARSYPDNVPEFGKSYFAKITFYLNNGTEKNWEGEVDWEKISGGKREVPMTRGTSEIGEASVSFPAQPSPSALDLAIQNVWVPSFMCNVIWGYRVFVDYKFHGDFPAVYTPTGRISYTLTDPQSITISGISPGVHHVRIVPLGIFYSPNLVTTDGRRYAFKKTAPNVFVWAWVDNKGNPISEWQPLSEIPKEYGDIGWPGYYVIHSPVFDGDVQFKKTGGGGGGGGLIQ